MARPALSASRGIDIIELLSAFPDRSFTLADIVRATGINAASCHAVVTALSERGYLLREHSLKTYRLGPALIATGIASARAQPIVSRIDRAARALLRDLGQPLLLTTIVGDEILALMTFEDEERPSLGMHVGERLPLVAPVGAPFLAWMDDAAQAAWIDRRAVRLTADHQAEVARDLELTRRRGFHLMLRSEQGPSIGSLLANMATTAQLADFRDDVLRVIDAFDFHMCQPEQLDSTGAYDVMLISAPIFDREGQVAYTLGLGGFTHRLAGDRLLALSDHLMRTCLEISRGERS